MALIHQLQDIQMIQTIDAPSQIKDIAEAGLSAVLSSSHNLFQSDLLEKLARVKSEAKTQKRSSFVRIKANEKYEGYTINWLLQGNGLDGNDKGFIFLVDIERDGTIWHFYYCLIVDEKRRTGIQSLIRVREYDKVFKQSKDLYFADHVELNRHCQPFTIKTKEVR